MDKSCLEDSSVAALGKGIIDKIRKLRFCIIGCGAVGSLFAEMLVRTGAAHLTLIDGDKVERKNLNRTFAYTLDDVDDFKVCALKRKLISINPNISVQTSENHIIPALPGFCDSEKEHVFVKSADIVIISADNNATRKLCERLCNGWAEYLSVGINVSPDGNACYECAWCMDTPQAKINEKGYGENNGSYASIVMEATSAGFGMLLNHLSNADSDYINLFREFNNFIPIMQTTEKPKSK